MNEVLINGDELYVSINFLKEKGIKNSTIHNGFLRNDKRRSLSWNRLKHPLNKKLIYVEYDSIPKQTKLKSKLLSKEGLIAKYLEVKKEKTEEEISITTVQISLQVAFNSKWREFLPLYITNHRREIDSINLAKNHAVLSELRSKKKYGVKIKYLYIAYNNCKENLKIKATNSKYFYSKLKELEEGNIHDILLHGNKNKASNSQKLTELHKLLLKQLFKNPKKFNYQHIYKKVNSELIEKGFKTISISTVQHYLTQPEVQNECKVFRNGKKWMDNNLLPNISRKPPENIGDQWQIDASKFQFPFKEGNSISHLTFFVVFDVHSRKIVGYSSDVSENKTMIIKGLEMAVRNCQYLPAEIVLDNGASYRSKEFQEVEMSTTISGVEWRRCPFHEPQGKGNVERFFGTFQTAICKEQEGYIGEGKLSNRENETYSQEYIQKIYNSKSIRNRRQLESLLDKLIEEYNNLSFKEKGVDRDCPNVTYIKSNPVNTVQLNSNKIVQIFWKKTRITIRKSMVNLTVNKVDYKYSNWSEDLIFKLNGRKVIVRYDSDDMSVVYLYDEENHFFLCKLQKDHKIQMASVSQTEKDILEIKKYAGRKKSTKERIKDRNRREREYLYEMYGVELTQSNSEIGKIIHLNDTKKINKGIYFGEATLREIKD